MSLTTTHIVFKPLYVYATVLASSFGSVVILSSVLLVCPHAVDPHYCMCHYWTVDLPALSHLLFVSPETSSPCAHIESLQFIIYLVIALNFYEFTIDIEVAFLNDPPDTTVYYEYPEGFPDKDPLCKQWAPGLTNIYGNPDSGRIFWKRLIPRLKAAGYLPTTDPGLLWHRNEANLLTVYDLHVDNFTFVSQVNRLELQPI